MPLSWPARSSGHGPTGCLPGFVAQPRSSAVPASSRSTSTSSRPATLRSPREPTMQQRERLPERTAAEVLALEVGNRLREGRIVLASHDRPAVAHRDGGLVQDPVTGAPQPQAQVLFLLVEEEALVEAPGPLERVPVHQQDRARDPRDALAARRRPPVAVPGEHRDPGPGPAQTAMVPALRLALRRHEPG